MVSIIFLLSGLQSPWQLAKQRAPSPDEIIPPSKIWIYPRERSAQPNLFLAWWNPLSWGGGSVQYPTDWRTPFEAGSVEQLPLNHFKYAGWVSPHRPLLQHLPRLVLLPPMKKTPPQRPSSLCHLRKRKRQQAVAQSSHKVCWRNCFRNAAV